MLPIRDCSQSYLDTCSPTTAPLIPVKIYQQREEVLTYLGVRHIAGIKPWDALAKARYVASLVEAGESYIADAQRIGSGRRTDLVRKWLLTLYSMDQANESADLQWDIADQSFGFSWLYTSIGYRTVRDYLGFTRIARTRTHIAILSQTTIWITSFFT